MYLLLESLLDEAFTCAKLYVGFLLIDAELVFGVFRVKFGTIGVLKLTLLFWHRSMGVLVFL